MKRVTRGKRPDARPVIEAPADDALALAIAAKDWERAALLLVLGMHQAARLLPDATVDDLLALLADGEAAT